MKYKFEIHQRLPSLNDYIHKINRNRYAGNKFKQDIQESICWEIKTQLREIRIDKPVILHITWIEENKRRDLDNICFAKKFILDSLVELRILKDDNRKMVCGFRDDFKYADKSMVIVELETLEEI